MSLVSFLAEAGEKLLGGSPAAAATTEGNSGPNVANLNATAGAAIAKYVASQGLSAQNLTISYDGASKTVTVKGIAPDQATKEKIVLCCGNVHSVAKVDDQLTVAQGATAASTLYEVKAGDTLSKIAKSVYGDANAYTKIFDANKPMLTDPNKIYPGQQLRIPAKS
ncbi:MAG TPA: peptidoglycan-binding protein LysM [Steroidobacteraceae bacterium]|jgi:nucleoid-associated protein YgaU|nr:peptidoglycan-binding protein LysM [Steroidobacteraceae bacterium]